MSFLLIYLNYHSLWQWKIMNFIINFEKSWICSLHMQPRLLTGYFTIVILISAANPQSRWKYSYFHPSKMELPGGIIKGYIKLIAYSKKLKGNEWSQECMWASREKYPTTTTTTKRQKKPWYFIVHSCMGQNSRLMEVKVSWEGKEYLKQAVTSEYQLPKCLLWNTYPERCSFNRVFSS